MSKAILVIDMPESCAKCPLCYDSYGQINFCSAQDRAISDFHIHEVQVWCPLRPMPEERPELEVNDYWDGYDSGYNACIDEILGG